MFRATVGRALSSSNSRSTSWSAGVESGPRPLEASSKRYPRQPRLLFSEPAFVAAPARRDRSAAGGRRARSALQDAATVVGIAVELSEGSTEV